MEVRRVDLANWALRTSSKFTTGVKYQFHQGFWAVQRFGRWGEWIWLTGPSGLHLNSPQGSNISSIRVFEQIRDPEIPITFCPIYIYINLYRGCVCTLIIFTPSCVFYPSHTKLWRSEYRSFKLLIWVCLFVPSSRKMAGWILSKLNIRNLPSTE